MTTLRLDYSNIIGDIKPLHSVGQPPFVGNDYSYMSYLDEANIPYSRLHDVGGRFGGNLYVDIPNIFRNFDEDENDIDSYDFTFTDLLIAELVKNNCEPIFRLGVSIENFHKIKAYRIYPPKNFKKWARICEHIIRHYNEGWGNGFHYGIKYWEIWNEPDNGASPEKNAMWKGTKEEYYELYRTVSLHLRGCFGDTIKIGGYGSCGFYWCDDNFDQQSLALGLGMKNDKQLDDGQKRIKYFIEFFEGFIDIVSKEKLPLDFFSYHSYSGVAANCKRQEYVEMMMEKAGLENVELHLNEWNPNARKEEKGKSVASATAVAMMCALHNSRISLMCYYDAKIGVSAYGGLFDPVERKPCCTYYGFKAYGNIYALGKQVYASSDNKDVFILGATDGENKGAVIVNTGEDTDLTIETDANFNAFLISEDNLYTEIDFYKKGYKILKNHILYLEEKTIRNITKEIP